MTRRARVYVGGVLGAGLLLSILALWRFAPTLALWETFAVLVVVATLAQLYQAQAPNHVLFYTSPIFFFAGELLLPPFLVILLVAVPHLIEWGKERWRHSVHLRAWYLQPFNIAMNGITGVSTYWLYMALSATGVGGPQAAQAIAGLATAGAYVCLNRLILALALILARKVSWRDSGMLDLSSLLTELALACLGLVVATLWQIHPAFIVPALTPLVLMYQALMIPELKHQAEIDVKTGLANAGHFKTLFTAELERARRFERPLAMVMADLDLFRNINNTYGHQAGDAVLAGIGEIIRQTVREYDIAGRFGGEEFGIVLPEITPHAAEALAERLRQAVAGARFATGTGVTRLGVSMSLGVACFPQDGDTVEALFFAADMSVYEAKAGGRNRVVRAADLPWERRTPQPEAVMPLAIDGNGPEQASLAGGGAVSLESAASAAPEEWHQTVGATAGPRAGVAAAAAEGSVPQPMTARVPAAGADAGQEAAVSHARRPELGPRLRHLLPQPGVAIVTMLMATVGVIAALRVPGISLGPEPLGVTQEAMLFAGAIVLAYQYPIHIRLHLKVQLSTMVYFLIATLLPLPLALGAAALGTVMGEVSVRQQRKLYPSDIATAVGRWVLLVLLGNLVAHLPVSGDGTLVPLAACALVLGLGDILTLPLILASMTGERPLRMLRALAVETTLPDGVQYLIGFLGVLVSQRAAWALALFVVPAALVYHSAKHLHDVQDATHRLLESMADTVDLRDTYTGGHSRRVTEYCRQLLIEMGLGGPDRELILSAARVHDIGKIALPDVILNKAGPLNGEERALMQTHSERGAEVLARHKDFVRGVAIVLHHHEAWDGSGYPHGLRGLEIPFGARVLAVADSFDAMTSDRPYRQGMSTAKAAAILRQGRGHQWDPQAVDAFLRSIADQLESAQRPHLQIVANAQEAQKPVVGAG